MNITHITRTRQQYLIALNMALQDALEWGPRVRFVPTGVGHHYDVECFGGGEWLRETVVNYALLTASAFDLAAMLTPKGEVVVSSPHGTVYCVLGAPKTMGRD